MKKQTNPIFRMLHSLLLRLAGVDPATARELPFHNQIRLSCLGLSIVLVSLMGTLGGWHTTFNLCHSQKISILVGLVSGAVFGTLDYFILVFMNKQNKVWVAKIRIATSLCIAVVTSVPIIVLSAHGPIVQYLNVQKQQQLDSKKTLAETAKSRIEHPVAQQEAEVKKLRNAYLSESDGTGGTRIRDYGPIARLKRAEYEKAEDKLNTLTAIADRETKKIDADLSKEYEKVESNFAADEMAQLNALFTLFSNPAILFRSLFLFALLVFLDIAPLILKLSNSEEGQYIARVNSQQFVKRVEDESKRDSCIRAIRLDARLTDEEKLKDHETKMTDCRNKRMQTEAVQTIQQVIDISHLFGVAINKMKKDRDAVKKLKTIKQQYLDNIPAKGRVGKVEAFSGIPPIVERVMYS